MDAVTATLSRALAEELPAVAQLAAWRLAAVQNDTQLLATLTRRATLAPEVRAEAARHRSPYVRAAYLTREDTTEATISASLGERSRSVMLEALTRATQDPSQAAARYVRDRFTSRPTLGLARAIATSSWPDCSLSAHAITYLVSHGETPTPGMHHSVRAAALEPEGARVLLEHAVSRTDPPLWASALAHSSTLTEDERDELISGYIARLCLHGSARTPRQGEYQRTALVCVNALMALPGGLPEANAATLLATLERHPEHAAYTRAAQKLRRYCTESDSGSLAGSARSIRTMEELYEYCAEQNLSEEHTRQALAEAAASSEMDTRTRATAITQLARYDSGIARGVLERRPGDTELGLALWDRLPSEARMHQYWKLFPASTLEAAQSIVQYVTGEHRLENGPSWVERALEQLLTELGEDSHHALLSMPWSVAEPHLQHGTSMLGRALTSAVTQEQLATFGHNSDCWETMRVLADGYTGTVHQLITASAYV